MLTSLSSKTLERLCNVAQKNLHKSDFKYQLVSIIFKKGRPLAIAANSSKKSYPFITKIFKSGTLHAEIASIVQIMHRDGNKDLDMIVYRQSNIDKTLKNAKPCSMCVQVLKETNWFRKIYWTSDDGTIKCDSIDNLYREVMMKDYTSRYLYNGKETKK